jgi:hypothetical protein
MDSLQNVKNCGKLGLKLQHFLSSNKNSVNSLGLRGGGLLLRQKMTIFIQTFAT